MRTDPEGWRVWDSGQPQLTHPPATHIRKFFPGGNKEFIKGGEKLEAN